MEKSFEEKVRSLKKGCIGFSVLQAIGIILTVFRYLEIKDLLGIDVVPTNIIISIIVSIVMIFMFYFIYTLTKKRKPLGPILEIILGVIYVLDGILLFALKSSDLITIALSILIGCMIIPDGFNFYKIIKNS